MKLTKENVCVFIENETQLEEARQLLEKYGEEIFKPFFCVSERKTYLRYDKHDHDWWCSTSSYVLVKTQITLQQLEEILKQSK